MVMYKFKYNGGMSRWELSRSGEVIMTWEGYIGEKEVEFWTSYAEEKNAEANRKLIFPETRI
jgi:hypothetical protein